MALITCKPIDISGYYSAYWTSTANKSSHRFSNFFDKKAWSQTGRLRALDSQPINKPSDLRTY